MAEQEPKGLGLEGWLNKLSQEFSINTGGGEIDPNQPMDDMAKMRWLMAIDRRYMWTMPRIKPGLVNEEVLQNLLETVDEYQRLLQAGLPQSPFYTEEHLRTKIADVLGSAGQACEMLRDYRQASQYHLAAAEIYTALGMDEQAQRCGVNLASLRVAQDGNFDDEIQRLRAELNTAAADPIDHADTMIKLAGLYSSNGDDYEAEELLWKAKLILDEAGDPSGSDLATTLTESLLSLMQGRQTGGATRIMSVMKVNELYRELYLSLARIYETTDRAKADSYRALATQRDSRANNDQFSEQMRRALEGDLGKLL